MAIPDWEQRLQYGLTCEYCHKWIQRLPCTAVVIGKAWVYYHNSCAKKAMNEDGF